MARDEEPTGEPEDSPTWCDICQEDVGWSSHYHCGRCGKEGGMYGCYKGNDTFGCDPADVERWKARQAEQESPAESVNQTDGVADQGSRSGTAASPSDGGEERLPAPQGTEGGSEGQAGCKKGKTCRCSFCKKGEEHEAAFARRDPDELIALVKKVRDEWLCAEFDNSYYQCIMNGSWPNAVDILTRALEKARQQPETTYG